MFIQEYCAFLFDHGRVPVYGICPSQVSGFPHVDTSKLIGEDCVEINQNDIT